MDFQISVNAEGNLELIGSGDSEGIQLGMKSDQGKCYGGSSLKKRLPLPGEKEGI